MSSLKADATSEGFPALDLSHPRAQWLQHLEEVLWDMGCTDHLEPVMVPILVRSVCNHPMGHLCRSAL